MQNEELKKPHRYIIRVALIIISAIVLAIALTYSLFVFSGIPFLRYWRDIYIETAMTTGDHQWLATAVIPRGIIDEVMAKQESNRDVIGGLETSAEGDGNRDVIGELKPDADGEKSESTALNELETKAPDVIDEPDPFDIFSLSLTKGDTDYAGYKVQTFDSEQGIVISHVTGNGYKGYVMLVDDPSRVFLAPTPYKNVEGLRIPAMLDTYDAIAGINASGFNDPNDNGTGGDVIGLSCSSGTYWGRYLNYYGSVVLTSDNRLVVGNVSVWQDYDVRDGIQFGPVLIANGKAQVEGSAGWGIQPRTAIGQREDGVIVMLVVDGRDITWSTGCTVGDLAEIMLKYGVINASCCDGGSSSVLAYDGTVINHNSSLNPAYGRRLPNAFLVKKK